jgi:hypothetical protein
MGNQNTITIRINADSSAAIAGFGQVQSSAQSLGDQITSLAAKVAAAVGLYKLIDWIKETVTGSATLAARVETLGVVLDTVGKNAGYSSDMMHAYAQSVEDMGITTQESYQTIIRMQQAHLDLAKATELARLAQDAAVIGNTNSSDALQRLVYGIQSAQVEMLRTIGINVNFEEAYQRVARQMGRTADSFSEAEKANIRMQAVLEKGPDIAGSYEAAMGTVGKLMTSMDRFAEQASLALGEVFKPALGEGIQFLINKLKDFQVEFARFKASGEMAQWAESLATGVHNVLAAMEKFGGVARTAISVMIEFKEEALAVSAALATFYIVKMLAAGDAIATVTKYLQELVYWAKPSNFAFLLQFAGIAGPAGIAAAAIGGLTYVVINHYQEVREEIAELERFKAVAATLVDESDIERQIAYWEIVRLEVEAVGGPIDKIGEKIQALNNQLGVLRQQGGLNYNSLEWGGDYNSPGRTTPVNTGAGDQGAANLKKAKDTNKKIQDELDKLTLSSIDLIHRQAAEYEKEGANRVLVAQLTAAKLKQIDDERAEKAIENIRKIAEQEQKSENERLILNQSLMVKDLESRAAIENKLDDYLVKAGKMTGEQAIQNTYTREREVMEAKLSEIAAKREDLAQNEYANQTQLRNLFYEELDIQRKIEASKKYEVYELDAKRLDTARQIADFDQRHELALLEMQQKLGLMSTGAAAAQSIDIYLQRLAQYKTQLAETTDPLTRLKLGQEIDDVLAKLVDLNIVLREQQGLFTEGLGQSLRDYAQNMRSTFQQGQKLVSDTATSMEESLSSVFNDFFTGDLKTWEDYWDSFWERLAGTLSDVLAQMTMELLLFGTAGKEGFLGGSSNGLLSLLGISGGSGSSSLLSLLGLGAGGTPSLAGGTPSAWDIASGAMGATGAGGKGGGITSENLSLSKAGMNELGPPTSGGLFDMYGFADYFGTQVSSSADTFAGLVDSSGTDFMSSILGGGESLMSLFTESGMGMSSMITGSGGIFGSLVEGSGTSFSSIIVDSGSSFIDMLGQGLSSILGGGGGFGDMFGSFLDIGMMFLSHGAAFERGTPLARYGRGDVFDSPVIFPMARGYGMMAEAGEEAVMPLKRLPNGDLGVKAETKSSPQPIIININGTIIGTERYTRDVLMPQIRKALIDRA